MRDFYQYLKNVETEFRTKRATEHTYRPFLKTLVESFAANITATNEPKREKVGAPDYIVTKGAVPLGYIEAKDVGRDLDKLNKTEQEQVKRYRESLNNLILTNYLEFRWYVRGELRKDSTVKIAEIETDGKIVLLADAENQLAELFDSFFSTQIETVATPKDLASRMAAVARLIRRTIERALQNDSLREPSALRDQMKSFHDVLLPTLKEEDFADLYAQTIAYGLFTARCYTKTPPFTRQAAAHYVPKTNPFLRELFNNIAGINLDERIVWLVDDLAELLNRTDISGILSDFGKRTPQEDPVVHFYETFLTAYDPKLRETRGVYYTPEPVVSYIVRSVDRILKEDFDLPKGLADSSKIDDETHRVLILDPATGTATFLYGVIRQIYKQFERDKGMWNSYVSDHLLPRIFGFELLVAPYAVAHLKLGLLLEELGYNFRKNERLGVYLTNTLEETPALSKAEGLTRWLGEEASSTNRIKHDAPVMVVLGNPPYEIASENRGKWILELIADYKKELKEKKLNLDDDFIKFIRFAQWRIEQTGYGILAFITNHSYLSGITHRRMRKSLMETFDDIYILDLHGNSKRKERAPDGSEDKNVFDIQQGVSIGIFVKKSSIKSKTRVFHSEFWGKRESKYTKLNEQDVSTTEWNLLKNVEQESCLGKFYFFTPKGFNNIEEYCEGWSVKDIFLVSGAGVKTERDRISIHISRDEIETTVKEFLNLSDSEIRAKYNLETDSRDWSLSNAKADLKNNLGINNFRQILYRPFDLRWTWYSGQTRGFIGTPAFPTMKHLLNENLALTCLRQSRRDDEGSFFVGKNLIGKDAVSIFDIATVFPLYLYPTEKKSLFDDEHDRTRKPNLSPEFVAEFEKKLNLSFEANDDSQFTIDDSRFTPEDVFFYAYAVFHSPIYRSRYGEFLKIDFPRLPLTSNAELFRALIRLCGELVGLHLLELDAPEIVNFPVGGDNAVEFVKYENGKVSINKEQFFEGIPAEIWEFHVGGYRVAEKWLKDRKGRTLSFDDLQHYRRTVAALQRTMEIMAEIDETIDAAGGFPLS